MRLHHFLIRSNGNVEFALLFPDERDACAFVLLVDDEQGQRNGRPGV